MNFSKLFFEREFNALAGNNWRSILTFSGLMLLTLLALAFALGSHEELSERMKNPYTNWVNLKLGKESYRDSLPKLLSVLRDSNKQADFELNKIIPYRVCFRKFWHNKQYGKSFNRVGRTISGNDPILNTIIDKNSENLLSINVENPKETFFEKGGIIVTKSFLENLGYSPPFEYQKRVALRNEPYTIYIDVVAVVDKLPDLCDFVISPQLYYYGKLKFDDPKMKKFIETATTNIFHFVAQTNDHGYVKNLVKSELEQFRPTKAKFEEFHLNRLDSNMLGKIIFPVNNKKLHLPDSSIYNTFLSKNKLQPYHKFTFHKEQELEEIYDPDQLAFTFGDLNKLRNFDSFLKKRFNISLEMNQVEEKNNFDLVSNLTLVLSFSLFIFSLLSIIFLTFFKLRSHLVSIKSNLGTFKAFGLDDYSLLSTYTSVIFKFLSIACMVGFVATVLIGLFYNLLSGDKVFDVFDWRMFIAIAAIFFINLLMAYYLIRSLLNDTPGNLIYNR